MPKLAKDAIPNELLRYERERRNLTQEDVVGQGERVNLTPLPPRQWLTKRRKRTPREEDDQKKQIVDPKMVGRWERGTLIPTRHYQRQLAAFFDRSERELGYLKEGIPFWDVRYKQNDLFTGREELLSQLADIPHKRNQYNKQKPENDSPLKQRPQVLTGVGGVGKTQIAVAYTYLYQYEYHTIIWLNASSLAELTSEFARIAEVLRLVDEQDLSDQRKMIAEAQTWLSSQYLTRWLLIFDNVDIPEIIHGIMSLLPQNFYGHVLLLSRQDDPGAEVYGLQQIRINSMADEEGGTLLLRRAGFLEKETSITQANQDDQQQAKELSHTLDGLPLALDQAGAYMREIPTTLSVFAKLYETRRAELLRHRGNYGFSHPDSVVVTWLLNFEQVGSEAQELLRLFAYLAPDDIPEELVTVNPQVLGPILALVASDRERLRKTVKNLRRYSLISRHTAERAYTIHRLVQAVTQDEMSKEEQKEWIGRAVRTVSRMYSFVDVQWKNTSEWWRKYEYFLPHALSCFEHVQEDGPYFDETSQLFSRMAFYLSQCTRYDEATPFCERVWTIQGALHGPEHPLAVQALNNLGVLAILDGRYEDADGRLRLALQICARQSEVDYAIYGACFNNVTVLRHFQGGHEKELEGWYRTALKFLDKKLNSQHPWQASVRANLAQLYRQQGRYEEARDLRQQSIGYDALDANIEEGIHQAKLYMAGGPEILNMEKSTEFPWLPSLLASLKDMQEQVMADSGITSDDLASLFDTLLQFFKIYSEQGNEAALAFFKGIKETSPLGEVDESLLMQIIPQQMEFVEKAFRFEGPEFDNTRETDIRGSDVGESFLHFFEELHSLYAKARVLFPIWLSDFDPITPLGRGISGGS